MAKVSRNAPCPCGSGKKFKFCCVDKKPEQERVARRVFIPLLLSVIAIGFGIVIGHDKGVVSGIVIGVGGLMIAGLVILLRDPPSSTGGGDPGAINFGG